jgi:carbon-monoxide dehydrogenase large subunit
MSAAGGLTMHRYDALTTGTAQYAGDLSASGAAHLVFVRSPVAHGRIVRVDTSAAAATRGVLGVFTAADLDLVPIWEIHLIPDLFGQPPLADEIVRYVGERVVAVVAESLPAAVDAAGAVVVEYEPRPAVVDARHAAQPEAMVLFPDHGTNVALEWHSDRADPAPYGRVTVEGVVAMPRVAVAPMEGLAILAVPGSDGRLTLHASTQSPYATQVQTARSLRVPLDAVRVVVPFVGGGFGGKALGGVADYVVTAAVARRLGRPVRFVEDRSSNLTVMQGRGMELRFRVTADDDGAIRHVDVEEICDAGAYATTNAVEPGKTMMMLAGPYRTPSVNFVGRSVVTNLAPTGAYRGPGRSEAAAVLERAMDLLARELAVDPVEIRARNLLTPAELPCESVVGAHYDEADHARALEMLIERSGYAELRAEQAARRARGERHVLGIGVATIVDSSAWFARDEPARVSVSAHGVVRVVTASASAGQGHAAAFRAIVSSILPVDPDAVEVVAGDTDEMSGSGSSGSRTIQLAGSAINQAAETVLDHARHVAAHLFEAAVEDIVVARDGFAVRGVPAHRLTLADVASAAPSVADAGFASLDARCVFQQEAPTYPSGAHLSVVEVDLETGEVRALRHVAVTDCGRVIDPPAADGQVIGASAQGVAQALYEQFVYDADGNPATSSFAEYLLPAASEQPPFETYFLETPTSVNPLGAKGVGEAGMVGAPAAVHSAVIDALSHLGVRDIAMPCTPERVWRALQLVDGSFVA